MQKPILSVNEKKHLEFLNRCNDTSDPIQTRGMQTDYTTAQTLEQVGALQRHFLETQTRGNHRIGFSISEKGKMLLAQMEQFESGHIELNSHKWQELIYYWQVWNTSRLITYAMNVLIMGSDKNHERNSEIILMEQDESFHAKGMVDIFPMIGSPNSSDTIPISAQEKSGGRFGTRLGKMDVWIIDYLYEYLGTQSPRALMEWLLSIGLMVSLSQGEQQS